MASKYLLESEDLPRNLTPMVLPGQRQRPGRDVPCTPALLTPSRALRDVMSIPQDEHGPKHQPCGL